MRFRACLKRPERGCVVFDQPQPAPKFQRPGHVPPCCGWSSTQPRSVLRQALSLPTLVLLLACQVAAATPRPLLLPPPDEEVRAAWRESLRLEVEGDFTGALAALRTSTPCYATLLRSGWLTYLAGNFLDSEQDYRKALRLAPSSLEARLGLLLPLLALDENREAVKTARQVLKESPRHPIALARLAVALRQQGRLKDAEGTLLEALTWHPTDVTLLTGLGLVRVAQARRAEARHLFHEIITLDPENEIAHAQLADPALSIEATPEAGHALTPAGTGPRAEATAYFGGITYEGTTFKDHAWIGGVNGWVDFDRRHLVEAGLDSMAIAYHDLPDLRQLDATAAYANFSLPRLKLRAGGHYTASDDPLTDGGWVAFGGIDWYAGSRWSVGLDGFFSRYESHAPGLDAFQLTPRLRVDLARGSDWTLRADVAGSWIRLDSPTTGLAGDDFFSGEGRLTLLWRGWQFSGFGWAGEQAFAVRNQGYTVYNLAQKHTGGYGAEIRRQFGERLRCGIRYQREEFREILTSAEAAENIFMATIGITF